MGLPLQELKVLPFWFNHRSDPIYTRSGSSQEFVIEYGRVQIPCSTERFSVTFRTSNRAPYTQRNQGHGFICGKRG
jgi:hypothetical protein